MTTPREALNALFSQGKELQGKALEQRRLEKEAESARKLARSSGKYAVRGAAADALATLAARIAAELQWTSRSLVTVFTVQHCLKCAHDTEYVTGVMVEQEHKNDPSARRLLRSVSNHPLLPKRRESWQETVEECAGCYSPADARMLPVIVPTPLIERQDYEEIQNVNN